MKTEKTGRRKLKRQALELLKGADFQRGLAELSRLPAKRIVNPLFSFFYNADERIKWRAVTAMGVVTAAMAETDMDSARVVMRRLLWNLNDESGGIGWGSPEALGEIAARSERLAGEYSGLLISFARKNGPYLEHELLQRGLLWGMGRLFWARPHLAGDGAELTAEFLTSRDPAKRGLAAWALGAAGYVPPKAILKKLMADEATFDFYFDGDIGVRSVKSFAKGLGPVFAGQGPTDTRQTNDRRGQPITDKPNVLKTDNGIKNKGFAQS